MGAVTAAAQIFTGLLAYDAVAFKPGREQAKEDSRKVDQMAADSRAAAEEQKKEFKAEKENVRERKKAVSLRASKRRRAISERSDAFPKGGTILTGPQGAQGNKIGDSAGSKTLLGA